MRESSNRHLRAKRLRRKMTLPEVLLWQGLRRREDGQPAWRRQHPFGPYVLDFFCAKANLCVEVDGEGHGYGDRPQRDARRDGYLKHHGVRTIRIPAREVLAGPSWIIDGLIREARSVA